MQTTLMLLFISPLIFTIFSCVSQRRSPAVHSHESVPLAGKPKGLSTSASTLSFNPHMLKQATRQNGFNLTKTPTESEEEYSDDFEADDEAPPPPAHPSRDLSPVDSDFSSLSTRPVSPVGEATHHPYDSSFDSSSSNTSSTYRSRIPSPTPQAEQAVPAPVARPSSSKSSTTRSRTPSLVSRSPTPSSTSSSSSQVDSFPPPAAANKESSSPSPVSSSPPSTVSVASDSLWAAAEDQDAIKTIPLALDDPLGQALLAHRGSMLIRGTVEYQCRIKTSENILAWAFNLRAVSKTREVQAALDAKQSYIPSATFYNDHNFKLKIKFIRALGSESSTKILKLGARGSVKISPAKTVNYLVEGAEKSGPIDYIYYLHLSSPEGTYLASLAINQPGHQRNFAHGNKVLMTKQKNEISFLHAMSRHSNSIWFYGAYPSGSEDYYNIAFEPIEGAWTSTAFAKFDHQTKTRMMIGAADAFAAFHASSFVHLAINASNLFYANGIAKVGGYSHALSLKENKTFVPLPFSYPSAELVESGAWYQKHPFKEDVFSLGIAFLMARTSKNSLNDFIKQSSLRVRQKMIVDKKWGKIPVFERDPSYQGKAMSAVYGADLFKKVRRQLQKAGVKEEEMGLLARMLGPQQNRPTMGELASLLREIHHISSM